MKLLHLPLNKMLCFSPRSLCFPHTLTAAELFKGFWSTAPRSKLCPFWKSCISTRNNWARWAHLPPAVRVILVLRCLQVCRALCTTCARWHVSLHIQAFHVFIFLCICGLLKLAMWCVPVSCRYMFFVLNQTSILPPHLFHLEISRRIIGDDTQNILYSLPWCTVQGQSNLRLLQMPLSSPPLPLSFVFSFVKNLL